MADILSVSQLNRYVKSLLDGDSLLKDLLLRGEISNFVCHQRSGHCYFTLKEGDCAVRAVMFSRYANDLLFEPENGMAVILRGAVSLYERDGSYQLYVYDMQPDGRGALQVAFEQLYRKLDRQGLFSQQNKQPIPTDARRIGVVTSASGAAFWDIVNVLSRRCPLATLVFCPAQVQGEAAAQSMVQALDALEQQGNCDVIILGRGGGSMEDLWCFNDEQLVRRVARCTVPLISAVGHETDFTLCDYAADLRAPTPSAAAELAAPDLSDLPEQLQDYAQRILAAGERMLSFKTRQILEQSERLARLSPQKRLRQDEKKLQNLANTIQLSLKNGIMKREEHLQLQTARLRALDPLAKLSGGYGYITKQGRTVSSVREVSMGDVLTIRVCDGTVQAVVEQVSENEESR
ncbi:MAG: exodeoxyribonuclease VII large subunit [Negativibacillus sp.]|nr:exodeoxyribonuclease VII large subunit [Negativibacillus sp.]